MTNPSHTELAAHMALVEEFMRSTHSSCTAIADMDRLEAATRKAVEASFLAALSHPSTPQGWKQIGWTCGDGDCGRIHESPGAEGSYAVPVYVPAPHTKETSP